MRQRNHMRPSFRAATGVDVADRIHRVREWRARYLAAVATTVIDWAARRLARLLHRHPPVAGRSRGGLRPGGY